MLSKIRAVLHRAGVALGMRRDIDRRMGDRDHHPGPLDTSGDEGAHVAAHRLRGQNGGGW